MPSPFIINASLFNFSDASNNYSNVGQPIFACIIKVSEYPKIEEIGLNFHATVDSTRSRATDRPGKYLN